MTAAVHRLVSLLLLLGVGVEFFFAGAGAFGATSFHVHRVVGFSLLAVAITLLVIAVIDRRNVALGLAVALLVAAQVIEGHLGPQHPWVGAVHGLTAAFVAGAAVINARKAWRHVTPAVRGTS